MQPPMGIGHQAKPVLAGIGIFPAEQSLAGAACVRRPEDDKQAAGRRYFAW